MQSDVRGGRAPVPGGWRRVHVRSFVLLAGAAGAKSLSSRVGRSVLDLPVSAELRLLDVWKRRIRDVLLPAAPGGCEEIPTCEIVISAGGSDPLPTLGDREEWPRVRVARDASDLRGTAGALRDLCEALPDEERIVVGIASQCPDDGVLGQLVREADPPGGVTLSADRDGAPSGLLLIRHDALASIAAIGFIDLKEQALPRISRVAGVHVIECPAVSPPLRDVRTYVNALRSWHRSGSLTGASAANPFEERWEPAFSIVEPGARVASSARLHDSVVLAGGVVESGGEVVRSVVGPGGIARRRARVVGQLLVGDRKGAGTPAGPPEAGAR